MPAHWPLTSLQVGVFQRFAAMFVQRQHRAFGQPGIHPERQRSAHQHLVEVAGEHLRQCLATIFARPGHARPAVIHILLVSLGKAVRRAYLAIAELTTLLVAVAIERRHHLSGVTCALFQHVVDQLAVEAVTEQLAVATDIEQLMQHKAHIAQRGLVAHTRPPCTSDTRTSAKR